jgi:uncharacterized small protein (DUF1192 family)
MGRKGHRILDRLRAGNGRERPGASLVVLAGCDNRRGGRYFRRNAEDAMASIDEDDRPKKKIAHEIGQDLALLSVEELAERIALLGEEIARLEAARTKKLASRNAADQFFKR